MLFSFRTHTSQISLYIQVTFPGQEKPRYGIATNTTLTHSKYLSMVNINPRACDSGDGLEQHQYSEHSEVQTVSFEEVL